MTPKPQRAAYSLLGFILLVYAVKNCWTTARELRRFYTNMWIWDSWDYLSHFPAYRHFDLTVFWIQHNEHREIGTELLYVIDIFLFHGRQILPELAGIAAYLGVLFLFAAFTWFWAANRPAALCSAILAAAIAGYKICAVSLASPFLTSWPQWEFFGASALAAALLHKKRGGSLLLVAAIASAVAATYSMSNGMLIWPLLFVVALLLEFSRREVAAVTIFGALSIGLYFFHYKNLHTLSFETALHHPAYFALFLGSFLGMPFSAAYEYRVAHTLLTALCGWTALALASANLFFIIRRKLWTAPAVIVLGGFCLLVLASSALTAFGRMDPTDSGMLASRAGRYVTEPTLFWCALLMLSVWLFGRAWHGYAAFVFLAITGLASALILPKTFGYYNWWDNYFQRGQWAAIGLANGVTDNAVGDVIFPSREYLAQFKPVLIANHLAMFAGPEPFWIGQQADKLFSRGPDGYIHGAVTKVKKLGTDYEVQGWADGVTKVIFVDETGRIVGFGMRPAAGPSEIYTSDVPKALAFTGFIRGEFADHQFSLWALDRKAHQMSRLGQLINELPR